MPACVCVCIYENTKYRVIQNAHTILSINLYKNRAAQNRLILDFYNGSYEDVASNDGKLWIGINIKRSSCDVVYSTALYTRLSELSNSMEVLEKVIDAQLVKNFPHFLFNSEGSLPWH
jgi:hypothetical protein